MNLLQIDGELTYKEISGKLKRSKSTIVERIKNLKDAGYIEKKVAIINIQKIRNIFTAFSPRSVKKPWSGLY
ncbi:Lrp/AsnC family transcriptional regulator [Pedobacter yonginense]|uniref:Lrp/AsnC family transcriptional regulator n=1 Tax=Pedobacter yonginense TaxID=651869 RepID=UPI001402C682